MLESLRARKAALRASKKKGFTLMEMLIVIAIIAILIAIAIPVFTSQLSSARAATDESNARSGYSQLQTELMLDESIIGDVASGSKATWYLQKDGSVSTAKTNAYTTDSASSEDLEIGGIGAQWDANGNIVYNVKAVDADGKETNDKTKAVAVEIASIGDDGESGSMG